MVVDHVYVAMKRRRMDGRGTWSDWEKEIELFGCDSRGRGLRGVDCSCSKIN